MRPLNNADAAWGRDERGAVLPLVALTLAVLLAFAALAIDVGHAYAERRRSQSAVDAGALAGAVEGSLSGDLQTIVDEITGFVATDLGGPVAAADWVGRCPDTGNPAQLTWTVAELGLSPPTECISFSEDFAEIRVTLPDRDVPTLFATLAGVDAFEVTATAQATLRVPGAGGSPPFVVTDGTKAGDQVCLRTSSSGSQLPPLWVGNGPGNPATQTGPPDPCDDTVYDPSSQFFGTLDPYVYREHNAASPDVACKNPGSNSIDFAIAEGIDHPLSVFPGGYSAGDPEKVDGAGCPSGPPTAFPNTMPLQTGFTNQILKCGLLGTGSGSCTDGPVFDGMTFTPRLQRGEYVQSTYRFAGRNMDNTPLWAFLDPGIGSSSAPTACKDAYAFRGTDYQGSPPWDYFDVKDAMVACLSSWVPADGPIFDASIVTSGRLAFIPQIEEEDLASDPVHFKAFVPVFLNKLYQAGKKSGSPDPWCWSTSGSGGNPSGWYTHEAGQAFDCGRPNQNVDRLAAIVIHCEMLPQSICVGNAGHPGDPGGAPVYEIHLSR